MQIFSSEFYCFYFSSYFVCHPFVTASQCLITTVRSILQANIVALSAVYATWLVSSCISVDRRKAQRDNSNLFMLFLVEKQAHGMCSARQYQ